MALPYNVARVLTYFQRTIYAYDLVMELVDHEIAVTKGPQYSFIGVIIPPTDKTLNLDEHGEIASASSTLYVNQKVRLSTCDAWDNSVVGSRQTIVLFDGDEYRVKNYSNRSQDGLHRKYVLEKYVGGRIVNNG